MGLPVGRPPKGTERSNVPSLVKSLGFATKVLVNQQVAADDYCGIAYYAGVFSGTCHKIEPLFMS